MSRPTRPPLIFTALITLVFLAGCGEGYSRGTLLAVDLTTGDVIWQTRAVAAGLSAPVVIHDLLLVQGGNDWESSKGVLAGYDLGNAKRSWSTSAEIFGPPGVAPTPHALGGVAVISDATGIRGLDAKTGKTLWKAKPFPLSQLFPYSLDPVLVADCAALFEPCKDASFNVVALDRTTGDEQWSATFPNVQPVPCTTSNLFTPGRFQGAEVIAVQFFETGISRVSRSCVDIEEANVVVLDSASGRELARGSHELLQELVTPTMEPSQPVQISFEGGLLKPG